MEQRTKVDPEGLTEDKAMKLARLRQEEAERRALVEEKRAAAREAWTPPEIDYQTKLAIAERRKHFNRWLQHFLKAPQFSHSTILFPKREKWLTRSAQS